MRQKNGIEFEVKSLCFDLNLLGQHRAASRGQRLRGQTKRRLIPRGRRRQGATRGASRMKLRSKETRRG